MPLSWTLVGILGSSCCSESQKTYMWKGAEKIIRYDKDSLTDLEQ